MKEINRSTNASSGKLMAKLCTLTSISLVFISVLAVSVIAQPTHIGAESTFRIGERLTFMVGFERYPNIAYAELYTVSKGRIGDVDAVELRAKVKTLSMMSAAFYDIDESRTILVSSETGMPLHITKTDNNSGIPKETVNDYLSSPAPGLDLVTMVYVIRKSNGSGAFTLAEGEKSYQVTFETTNQTKVRSDAGDFDSSTILMHSDFFTERGMKNVRINISSDELKLPLAFRFETDKGQFRARITSIQNLEAPPPSPTPTPAVTPTPLPTPSVSPTPRVFENNQPLGHDLSFVLGETLEYNVTTNARKVGTLTLKAVERKLFEGKDSLLLLGTVTDAVAGQELMTTGDSITAQVNPESLAPRQLDILMNGSLKHLNQRVRFNELTNQITFKVTNVVDSPVGTHSILSLLYAMRSFNLKPSRDNANPVNDTRVAVFWDTKPYVFTLRPSPAEDFVYGSRNISAQLISISTGNPQLDSLNLKVWLSNDVKRLPLRIIVGQYQADLISERVVTPN